MAATSFFNLVTSYPELLLATISFLVIYFYYQSIKKSAIPINWPLLGMLPGLLINLNRFHDWLTDLLLESNYTFKFTGPLFLGLDFWLVCDPANVNHVFNANFSNYPKGEEFVEIFDILGGGIFNADADSWKAQRKKAHSAVTNPSFRAFLARYSGEKVENALIPVLEKLADENAVFDLQGVFLRLTFDMTCSMVFGVDPGCLSEGLPRVPFADAMDDAMEAIFFRHVMPASWWKLSRRLGFGVEKRLRAAGEVIDGFVADNIARKKKEGFHGEDLLSLYMDGSEEGDDRFLRDTTVNLMVAGRETTGVALSWFFYLTGKHPEVKSRIIEELAEKKGFGGVEHLVYLHAAVCESLRLFPSVPFEHKSPLRTEYLPSGEEVRCKDKIFFSTYSMGRMEGVWGKDCLEFRPERWITEGGKMKHEPSYKFLSFNCGPRTCLGKEIALTQMKCVIARVLWDFDVELMDENGVEPKLSIILHMKNGLEVRIRKRKNNEMLKIM